MITQKHLLILILFATSLINEGQGVKYNDSFGIACHNCFDPKNAPSIEDALNYTTNLELDIWDNQRGSGFFGKGKLSNHWFVKHESWQKGNVNCCGGSLSDCLIRLNAWSDAHPKHTVVTVFIDKKENWGDPGERRSPEDLDLLLFSVFKDKLLTPETLLKNSYENLREMARDEAWPSMRTLKGMFIFVITDGTEITSRNPLNEYLLSRAGIAKCFVAPHTENPQSIDLPQNFSQSNVENIVFFNLKYESKNLSLKINELNFLSRVYGAPESEKSLSELMNLKVNFSAFTNYKINSTN